MSNQLISLPLIAATGNKIESQSIVNRLIDFEHMRHDLINPSDFDGSLIPPQEEWQNKVSKLNIISSKVDVLRRGHSGRGRNGYRWMLDQHDYERFQFTKRQATFLRMVEIVRKFVLEFQFIGVTDLWP
eukprot:275861_1